MNYRSLYEKHYDIKIPSGFVIHHIDGNRENNNIDNLILLPKNLHAKFHFVCDNFRNGIDKSRLMEIAMDIHQPTWYRANFKILADILPEIWTWVEAKYFEDWAISQDHSNDFANSYNCFRK